MIQSFLLNRTNRTPYTRLDHTTTGSFTLLGSAAIVLLFILTHASLVQGATYYVATTGSDSNIGTLTSPFRTIKKGITVLSQGDTLSIRGGNYDEEIDSSKQTIPAGTSWSSAITIAAYTGESVTIRKITLLHSHIRYLVFQGLIIDARFSVHESVYLNGGTNHIRFRDCEIKNANAQGVLIPHWGADYNEFINCNVHSNGKTATQDHGFYIGSSNNLIEGCLVHDNAAYGVHIYNGYAGERANNNVVRSNRIYNNSRLGMGSGVTVGGGSGNAVYNNVIWGHASNGIDVAWKNPSDTKVYNNTIYKNAGGILVNSDSTGAIVKNNIIYQAASLTNKGVSTVITNNSTVDPKFVDPSTNNFRLQAGSPAIDGGVSLTEVGVDIEGLLRPQGIAIDLGAHEYKSQQALPVPPTNLVVVAP